MKSILQIRKQTSGQVALTTVFLIGSFVVLMALTLAFISISVISSNRAIQSAGRALAAASAGANDGVLRLVRNSTYSGNSTLNVNGNVVFINVSNTQGGQATITATSTVGSSQKTVQAIVSIVTSTGQVSIVSMKQIP